MARCESNLAVTRARRHDDEAQPARCRRGRRGGYSTALVRRRRRGLPSVPPGSCLRARCPAGLPAKTSTTLSSRAARNSGRGTAPHRRRHLGRRAPPRRRTPTHPRPHQAERRRTRRARGTWRPEASSSASRAGRPRSRARVVPGPPGRCTRHARRVRVPCSSAKSGAWHGSPHRHASGPRHGRRGRLVPRGIPARRPPRGRARRRPRPGRRATVPRRPHSPGSTLPARADTRPGDSRSPTCPRGQLTTRGQNRGGHRCPN